ncbi:MAG: penicillin-binding protein [Bryobacterales bacterium]|nr:transpeptidase family protein [Bryobacteraceae bacterium]MDW8356031.1 penicillin-binding protein [Bryobacterales bacterium]
MSGTEPQGARRLLGLGLATLVWAGLIVARLVQLQLFEHDHYRELANQQQQRKEKLRPVRGAIVDRNGVPLALSLAVESVALNPKQAPPEDVAAGILAPILGLNEAELGQRIREARQRKRGFMWIKRRISREEAAKLRSLRLGWIQLFPDSLRCYPNGPLAAHVVGSVDSEGRGNAGIEQTFERELRGIEGEVLLLADVHGRALQSRVLRAPVPGRDVVLTLDSRLQAVAEQALGQAAEAEGCTSASLVVMNPHTGEILALASYPPFDPNLPPRSPADLQRRENHAVSVPFEPGSVFKVVTVAAGLETAGLRPETVIPCGSGRINLFGRLIRDHHAYAALPVSGVLAKSSNIGAIQIGLRVGEAQLLEYVRRFGFGRSTGLPLPGESAGKVRDLKNWTRTSIGSVAMGHEISATTVQLARACSVIANGGVLVAPRLVLAPAPERAQPRGESSGAPRVIRPETAILLRRMMEGVVLEGTGRLARLEGYTAGGKTGSAQIFDRQAGRYTHRYNASFMGFAPVPKPAVVIVVTLNGASRFGGAVAAPVFRTVASAALRLLDVPPDLPELAPHVEKDPAARDDGPIAELSRPLETTLSLPGQGVQPAAWPAAPGPAEVWGPRVPDFRGKTVRDVVKESAELGLPVELAGAGLARAQFPPAGAILPPGQRVVVQFSR